MGKFIDLTGKQYGNYFVISKTDEKVGGFYFWNCRCTCGTEKKVLGNAIRYGKGKGCKACADKALRTHGLSNSKLYSVWASMKSRCTNTTHHAYKDYGARGITVCKEWLSFEKFYDWAMSSCYIEGKSIDRVDNNLGYSPNNCKWAGWLEQNNNRRNTRRLPDGRLASEVYSKNGISIGAFNARLRMGWDSYKAATFPIKKKTKKVI
jgi:hypothetical protein